MSDADADLEPGLSGRFTPDGEIRLVFDESHPAHAGLKAQYLAALEASGEQEIKTYRDADIEEVRDAIGELAQRLVAVENRTPVIQVQPAEVAVNMPAPEVTVNVPPPPRKETRRARKEEDGSMVVEIEREDDP